MDGGFLLELEILTSKSPQHGSSWSKKLRMVTPPYALGGTLGKAWARLSLNAPFCLLSPLIRPKSD